MYKTRLVKVGPYTLGTGHPVRVQSMCNTDTRDPQKTAEQINQLEAAGCEINRVAVPDMQAALALGEIKKRIHSPLVADIHFDYKLALEAIKQGVDKVRINPGNIGSIENTKEVVRACKDKGVAIRIGVNAGSVKYLKSVAGQVDLTDDKWAEVMVQEALEQANVLEQLNFHDVVVSLKSDDFYRTLKANELFAAQSDIPLHIGLTEAGSFLCGAVKSSIALGTLLQKGIGATIRVSLTEAPRLQVRTAYEILKALGLREYGPNLISCPTCGRTQVDVTGTVHALEERIYNDPELLQKATGLKIAVMGCVVNGPGEARDAAFGIAGGKGEGLYFEKGQTMFKLPQEQWVDFLVEKIKTWKE